MPITAACFVIGALAIAGLPPFNGFFSKLTVYLALARAELWWAVGIALLTSILTMVVLVRAAYAVFWGELSMAGNTAASGGSGAGGGDGGDSTVVEALDAVKEVREVPALMWMPMVLLAAACIVLGLYPAAPYALLDKAAVVLATLGR